uniref:Uncharacterized protein n=1 Tax=Arundo donax TaxID=35708 RepID=A0A0A9GQT8_ARUDO
MWYENLHTALFVEYYQICCVDLGCAICNSVF